MLRIFEPRTKTMYVLPLAQKWVVTCGPFGLGVEFPGSGPGAADNIAIDFADNELTGDQCAKLAPLVAKLVYEIADKSHPAAFTDDEIYLLSGLDAPRK